MNFEPNFPHDLFDPLFLHFFCPLPHKSTSPNAKLCPLPWQRLESKARELEMFVMNFKGDWKYLWQLFNLNRYATKEEVLSGIRD